MTEFKKILRYLIFALLIFSCQKNETPQFVARVDDQLVTPQEFADRYRFNPYLTGIKNQSEARKVALSALIAEKLLAAEAHRKGFTNPESERWIEEHLREAMIEQLRRDSVEKEITVTDEELRREYRKALKKIRAKFYLCSDSLAAVQVAQRLKSGASGQQAVAGVRQKLVTVTQKEYAWPVENEHMEKLIYNLHEGEINPPQRVREGFLVAQVQKVATVSKPSQQDFESRLPALRDHLLRRKIKARYTHFYRKQLVGRLGAVDWTVLSAALEKILPEIDFHQPKTATPFGQMKSLPDRIVELPENVLKNLARRVAVRFPSGKQWTVRQLFSRIKYGPYAFNYSDPEKFRKSFRDNVRLLLEHQAIYEMADELGYRENPQVVREAAMWNSYYTAQAFRYHLLSDLKTTEPPEKNRPEGDLTPLQEKRLQFMDEFLTSALARHEVIINQKVFAEWTAPKTDMLVMKRHFAHRLIAPRLQPLTRLIRWQKQIDRLYRKYGIG